MDPGRRRRVVAFLLLGAEAVEPSGTPEGDGEFPGTSGRDGADALAATGTLLADLEDHDDARDLAASDDGHLDDANHDAGDREPFARRHRTRRQKLVIIGEAEARARRRPRRTRCRTREWRASASRCSPWRRAVDSCTIRSRLSSRARTRERESSRIANDETRSSPWITRLCGTRKDRWPPQRAETARAFPSAVRLLQGFYDPLTKAIELEQEAVRLKVPGVDRSNYGPFLLMLNADKLSVITLHTVISQLMKGDEAFSPDTPQAGMCKFVRVVERLGEAVQAEVNLARLRQRARISKRDAEAETAEEAAGTRDLAEIRRTSRISSRSRTWRIGSPGSITRACETSPPCEASLSSRAWR